MAADDTEHEIKTIRCSMARQDLKAKTAKPFKLTTDSDHKFPITPNLLERHFTADNANQKWARDITYLYTSDGWLYLSMISTRERLLTNQQLSVLSQPGQ